MDLVHSYQGSENYQSHLPFPNLAALLESHRDNSAPFLHFYRLGQMQTKWTYQEFYSRSEAWAERLQTQKQIRKGDRVILLLANGPEILTTYAALFLLGAVAVPLNPAETAEFIETIAQRTGAKLILRQTEVTEALAAMSPKDVFFQRPADLDARDPAAIFFTSGTTGTSKGAVLTHGNLLINSVATQGLHRMTTKTAHLAVLPLFHVNAFSFSFLTSVLAGSRLVLHQNFFQPNFWRIVKNEGVEIASLVPSILELLNRDPSAPESRSEFPRLKYFVTAAAPLSATLLRDFFNRFGVRIVQAYGLSETVNFSLTIPPDLNDEEYARVMLRAEIPPAGVPVFGNELAVLDPETGQSLAAGEKGELVIRGWNVMDGYFSDADSTARAFAAGWFHTGDLGYFEESAGRRYYSITGRVKEVVKRNGELIALSEIDRAIQTLPGLAEAVAVGFGHRLTGEEVGLFVVRGAGTPSAEEILKICRSKFPAFRSPKVVVFGGQIPRTPTGKIKRHLLKEYFADYAEVAFNLK